MMMFCNHRQPMENPSPQEQSLQHCFKSADKESLKSTILDVNLQNSIFPGSTLSQGYVSLLGAVQRDDPILSQFTKRRTGIHKK